MADKHPAVTTMTGLTQVLDQLKRTFPVTLNADVLKRLSLAPSNEGVVINSIRFLGLIDEENRRTELGHRVFTLHDEKEFQREFSKIIQNAYKDLFSYFGDATWDLEDARLITFFRQTDQSSELVGKRQARTFKTLASYAGKSDEFVQSRSSGNRASTTSQTRKKTSPSLPIDANPTFQANETANIQTHSDRNVGLTVRIEINLPVAEDQETYDKIFRSIRENLLNDPE